MRVTDYPSVRAGSEQLNLQSKLASKLRGNPSNFRVVPNIPEKRILRADLGSGAHGVYLL